MGKERKRDTTNTIGDPFIQDLHLLHSWGRIQDLHLLHSWGRFLIVFSARQKKNFILRLIDSTDSPPHRFSIPIKNAPSVNLSPYSHPSTHKPNQHTSQIPSRPSFSITDSRPIFSPSFFHHHLHHKSAQKKPKVKEQRTRTHPRTPFQCRIYLFHFFQSTTSNHSTHTNRGAETLVGGEAARDSEP